MKIHLITNMNGRGLEQDALLLRELLNHHDVAILQFDRKVHPGHADLNIFLEVTPEWCFKHAEKNWLIPNVEWWGHPGMPIRLACFDRVLVKTKHARDLLQVHNGPHRIEYVGFLARDRCDPDMTPERKFLHIAGRSTERGTQVILDAWSKYKIPHKLTVVADLPKPRSTPNVKIRGWLPDDELQALQNTHMFHLQPSATEGFGHTLWEALSVDATLIRPAWPPMNELPGVDIRCSSGNRKGLAITCRMAPLAIHEAVMTALSAEPQGGRVHFLRTVEAFKQRFLALIHEESETLAAGSRSSRNVP